MIRDERPNPQLPIPLTDLRAGESGTIAALGGGRAFQARLIGMGLHVGTTVRVLSGNTAGPTLVAAGETRLAIGHGMARRILVRPDDRRLP